MNRSQPRRSLAVLAVTLVGLIAGCNPVGDGPLLSDPREILSKAIAATAPLRTVRVRIDAAAQSAPDPRAGVNANQQGGWVEADVDIARHEVNAHGGTNDGTGLFEVIVADNAIFVKNTSTGRWAKTAIPAGTGVNPPGPLELLLGRGAMAGGMPDVPAVLGAALADGSVGAQLKGIEDCRTGRCYRTAVTIPPQMVWQLVVKLTGMDRLEPSAVQQPPLGDVPAVNLELLTDTKKLWLVDGVASGSSKGSSATVRLQLGKHDEPLVVQPPPPALVDNQGGLGFGFGGGSVERCVNSDGSPCKVIDHVGASLLPERSP